MALQAILLLLGTFMFNGLVSAFLNLRGVFHFKLNNYNLALRDIDKAIRLNPTSKMLYCNRAIVHRRVKDFEKALADFSEAIRLDPTFAVAYNGRAWLMATCPEEQYRNGSEAVEMAKRACELQRWTVGNHIATLAAAYAETGNFESAIKYQMEALDDPAYERGFGDKARERLKQYRQDKPYRAE